MKKHLTHDRVFLITSIILQLGLAFFFGHAYDMRIFIATGYLVGTGQNPYIAQDLASIFNNSSFQGITSVGYLPPWPLVDGLIYFFSYRIVPNLLLYNLALKLPIIAANISLAYLVANILRKLKADEKKTRLAWLFILFNPFFLYATCAWGQFDSIVAFFTLLALVRFSEDKLAASAIWLALAITLKPTAIPVILAIFAALLGRPFRVMFRYFVLLFTSALILIAFPFIFLSWDPSPILQHWNAHFTVGGGISFMTFLELVRYSYQLPGLWWLVGLAWIPALVTAALFLRPGPASLVNLLRKSTIMILVFFLFRSWVSETNLILLIPLLLILTGVGELNPRILTSVWVLALSFSFFSTSPFQLLFPSLPALMDRLLQLSEVVRTARLVIRTIVVIPWLVAGAWMVIRCIRQDRFESNKFQAQSHPLVSA
jgi:hypothetical protein